MVYHVVSKTVVALAEGGGGTYALSPLSLALLVGARAAPDLARPTSNWADERTDGRTDADDGGVGRRTIQRTDALSV